MFEISLGWQIIYSAKGNSPYSSLYFLYGTPWCISSTVLILTVVNIAFLWLRNCFTYIQKNKARSQP